MHALRLGGFGCHHSFQILAVVGILPGLLLVACTQGHTWGDDIDGIALNEKKGEGVLLIETTGHNLK